MEEFGIGMAPVVDAASIRQILLYIVQAVAFLLVGIAVISLIVSVAGGVVKICRENKDIDKKSGRE